MFYLPHFAGQCFSDWLLEQAKYIKTCPVMDDTFIMRYIIDTVKVDVLIIIT